MFEALHLAISVLHLQPGNVSYHCCMCTGEPLTADKAQLDFLTESPNMYQMVAQMFQNPERMQDFFEGKCAQADIQYPGSIFYSAYLKGQPPEGEEYAVSACADIVGALENYIMCDHISCTVYLQSPAVIAFYCVVPGSCGASILRTESCTGLHRLAQAFSRQSKPLQMVC
jgi:hypothetical protein